MARTSAPVLRYVAAALVVVVLALPAQARADTFFTKDPVQAGPVLAGTQAVWVETPRDGSMRVHVAPPGGTDRVVLQSKPDVSGQRHLARRLTASSRRVVLLRGTFDASGPFVGGSHLLVGTPNGNFEEITESNADGDCSTIDAAIDGDLVATTRGNCTGAEVAVRDLGSGGAVRTPKWDPRGLHLGYDAKVKVAGRFVAWLARGAAKSPAAVLVVFDLVADREAYRVDVLPFMGANPPVNYELEFDLDDDGTIVAAVNNYDARDAGPMPIWASLEDPAAHAVPFRLATQGVALRNGLVAVRGKTDDSYAVIDLQGTARNVFAYQRAQDTGLDFDGFRVVWSQHTQVFVPGQGYGLKYSVHNEPYPVVARPEVPRGDATVGADGSSSLPVWCPSATTTCSGTLTLMPASDAQAARAKSLARREFKIPARKVRSVRIQLSRGARAELKRKGRLRANALVRVETDGGATRGAQRILLKRRSPRASGTR